MSVCGNHNCSICCKNREVVLTHEDISKLLTMGHYEQVFARKSKHGHNIKELIFVNGECIFLKTGKCSVYNNRPTACRIFPYTITDRGEGLDPSCPNCEDFKNDPIFLDSAQKGLQRIVTDIQRTLSHSKDMESSRNRF